LQAVWKLVSLDDGGRDLAKGVRRGGWNPFAGFVQVLRRDCDLAGIS
jgi:hypothetical protein